jgi:hypothetical protein
LYIIPLRKSLQIVLLNQIRKRQTPEGKYFQGIREAVLQHNDTDSPWIVSEFVSEINTDVSRQNLDPKDPAGSFCRFQGSVLLKILFEFNQRKTSEAAYIVIYPVGRRIFSHGGNIFEIVKVVFAESELRIIERLDALALIHIVGFEIADAKVSYPYFSTK